MRRSALSLLSPLILAMTNDHFNLEEKREALIEKKKCKICGIESSRAWCCGDHYRTWMKNKRECEKDSGK